MGWTRWDKGGKTGKEENLLLTPFDDHSFEFRGVLFQHCWQICFIWNSGCFCWDCGVSQSDSEDDFCTENEFVQLCSTSIVCHLSNIILGLKWNQTWESTAGAIGLPGDPWTCASCHVSETFLVTGVVYRLPIGWSSAIVSFFHIFFHVFPYFPNGLGSFFLMMVISTDRARSWTATRQLRSWASKRRPPGVVHGSQMVSLSWVIWRIHDGL
jgi:hypothetical protein